MRSWTSTSTCCLALIRSTPALLAGPKNNAPRTWTGEQCQWPQNSRHPQSKRCSLPFSSVTKIQWSSLHFWLSYPGKLPNHTRRSLQTKNNFTTAQNGPVGAGFKDNIREWARKTYQVSPMAQTRRHREKVTCNLVWGTIDFSPPKHREFLLMLFLHFLQRKRRHCWCCSVFGGAIFEFFEYVINILVTKNPRWYVLHLNGFRSTSFWGRGGLTNQVRGPDPYSQKFYFGQQNLLWGVVSVLKFASSSGQCHPTNTWKFAWFLLSEVTSNKPWELGSSGI